MKKVLGILGALLGLTVIVVVGLIFVPQATDSLFYDASENAKAVTANTAIEASGVKQRIADTLASNRQNIADATGLSLSEVDSAIEALDIESWEACALPSDARSTGSFEGSYGGMAGTVTTYEDPGYVTIEVSGQNVTLAVPDSAQGYESYLQYLQ